MKAYWRYMCDEGHQWSIFRDEDAEEHPEDRFCPEGHEMVTLNKERALDDVIITFRPAGRIVDRLKGQEAMRGRYYVVLSNMDGSAELVSKKVYSFDDACRFCRRFDKRPFEWALRFWAERGSHSA